MKLNIKSPLVVLCLFFTIITLFSCSKDSDLMADYIALDPEVLIGTYVKSDNYQISISPNPEDDTFEIIVNTGSGGADSSESNGTTVNDSYQISSDVSIILDVLANDTFKDLENVSISETSQPSAGSLVINDDNTLTYTPTVVEATEDTFTYTTEFVNEDGKASIETGTVTVTINEGSKKMGELKAFPGAEGFGKNTTGGRGGIVYHVTNLNDSGGGSLRYGMETLSGPRTIVFDVSGYINIDTPLKIRAGYGNITIAGQTAPGDGITIRGASIWVHAGNVILRYLKVRPGLNAYNPAGLPPSNPDYEPDDGIKIVAYSGNSLENVIVDHCTVTWAHDGLIDIGSPNQDLSTYARNITIQNCLLGENIDKKYGVLIQRAYDVSFYRNILAFTMDRNIAIQSAEGKGAEMVNNLVYGTSRAAWYIQGNVVDFVSNKFISGPMGREYETFRMELGPLDYDINNSAIYLADNLDDSESADKSYNNTAAPFIVSSPNYNTDLKIVSQSQLESTLIDYVGDNIHYDEADKRIMNSIKNRTGNIISDENSVGGYPTLKVETRSDNYDSDRDGMADIWEITVYEDLSKEPGEDEDGDGYTNIEAFLFYLEQ